VARPREPAEGRRLSEAFSRDGRPGADDPNGEIGIVIFGIILIGVTNLATMRWAP
jgi:hypothetical protein